MTPEQTYASMSDEQIVEFCRVHLPGFTWRAERNPRSTWVREAIIAELTKRPLLIERGE